MLRPLCNQCGKTIIWPKRSKNSSFKISSGNYIKKKFCNLICRGNYTSINRKGVNNFNFRGGKNKCIDCNKILNYRNPNRIRCRECWYKFIKLNPRRNYHKCKICDKILKDYKAKLCRKCYRKENHPNWKGGITKLQNKIRALPKYRKWYMSVFSRDNFTCQKCKFVPIHKSNFLVAHHLKHFALILKEKKIENLKQAQMCKELWDISNGITFCKNCHKLFHKKL